MYLYVIVLSPEKKIFDLSLSRLIVITALSILIFRFDFSFIYKKVREKSLYFIFLLPEGILTLFLIFMLLRVIFLIRYLFILKEGPLRKIR